MIAAEQMDRDCAADLADIERLSLMRDLLSEPGDAKCQDCAWASRTLVSVDGGREQWGPSCVHPRNETGAVDPCPILDKIEEGER